MAGLEAFRSISINGEGNIGAYIEKLNKGDGDISEQNLAFTLSGWTGPSPDARPQPLPLNAIPSPSSIDI